MQGAALSVVGTARRAGWSLDFLTSRANPVVGRAISLELIISDQDLAMAFGLSPRLLPFDAHR